VARDPYEYFRVEAREILEDLGRGVLELERSGSENVVSHLLRLAHTLKGAARVVRQPGIAEQAHAVEETLAPMRNAGAAPEREAVERLLALVDAMAAAVKALDLPARAFVGPSAGAAVPGTRAVASVEDVSRSVRADAAELDALMEGVAEASVQLLGLRRGLFVVERARRLSDLLTAQLAPRPTSPVAALAPAKLRAAAEELSDLLGGASRSLATAVEQTERELREVRGAAERLRLLPANLLFTPLERVARDTAAMLGKEAVFASRGGDVRIEATVLGVVQGALVQMVRNAIAHGTEMADERVRLGKPRAGRVEVEVSRRNNRVAFVCRDDGRGVDLAAVTRAAQQRGLLPEGSGPRSSDELLTILLRGGLTTVGTVTQAAGRGVGLDVVREVAVRLGGEVTAESDSGRGTTVTLVVPLSLSALDALLVEEGGVVAAIPLSAVRGGRRLAPGDLTRAAGGDAIVHEGEVIPFTSLGRSLGHAGAARADGPRSVIVVEGPSGRTAVGVTRLRGVGNVVVRPLPSLTPAAAVVAGAALGADGTAQLVLDPDGLVAAALAGARAEAPPEPRAPAAVLVVDDSLTTRMMERSILESAGYEVDLATSGEEGLEKARRRRYQLFLCDVEMPGMDGFAFVAATRADPGLREVPAILVTSRSAPEDVRRGAEVGASGYVVKGDFDQDALLATIRRLVGR
jgi:two-component system chemotaxis sensor kinase CheA